MKLSSDLGRERIRQKKDRVEQVSWLVKNSGRSLGVEFCQKLSVCARIWKWIRSWIFIQWSCLRM